MEDKVDTVVKAQAGLATAYALRIGDNIELRYYIAIVLGMVYVGIGSSMASNALLAYGAVIIYGSTVLFLFSRFRDTSPAFIKKYEKTAETAPLSEPQGAV